MLSGQQAFSQTITGAWKGKIGSARTFLKIIKKGDSLVGTSYYYTSKNSYRRYAIRGYFDSKTNDVIWWDEALLEDKVSGKLLGKDKDALLAVADFNCPGEDEMLLNGESTERDNKDKTRGPVQLQKVKGSEFPDEWDFVIENYFVGANDPDIIDSIAHLRNNPAPVITDNSKIDSSVVQKPVLDEGPSVAVKVPAIAAPVTSAPSAQQKLVTREKKLATVIPVTGDSIEIRFYDNAVVDGDSISVFLNNNLVFEHVRLNYKPYTIKIAVTDLQDDNEMVMVAENLGTIPPNTSLMVVMVGDKRYEARLESNEQTSALIRFIKQR
jgi:hypothetical protein